MYESYQSVNIEDQKMGTGWLPPMPDFRDYTDKFPKISTMTKKLGLPADEGPKALPPNIDLRKWCSAVENQQSLGSCSAHAAVGIVEYFQYRAFAEFLEGSRLFVYKTTTQFECK